MPKTTTTKAKKESTGMVKRSNPLSLTKQEEIKTVATPVVKAKKVSPRVSADPTLPSPLPGQTQWLFFLPSFNKALLTELKTQFPTLSNQALIEKALVTLLKQSSSEAYDRFLTTLKK